MFSQFRTYVKNILLNVMYPMIAERELNSCWAVFSDVSEHILNSW